MMIIHQMIHMIWIGQVLAVPPPSADDVEQLRSARDAVTLLDEAALYPLLRDALTWRATDESGAMVPDYAAIRRRPETYRGNLFLIEGPLAGQPRPIRHFQRPGPWEGRLQQWSILVHSNSDEVVVVYLVNPPPASVGQSVRLPGRFYKLWSDVDQTHQPTNYLVFVGHAATVSGPAARPESSVNATAASFLGVVLVMVLAYVLMRIWIRPRPRAGPQGHHRVIGDEPGTRCPLPDDPAGALEELGRRHAE